VSDRALRDDFDHKVGRSPHLIANDREPFSGHEQHVGLNDERAVSVEHDVNRRGAELPNCAAST